MDTDAGHGVGIVVNPLAEAAALPIDLDLARGGQRKANQSRKKRRESRRMSSAGGAGDGDTAMQDEPTAAVAQPSTPLTRAQSDGMEEDTEVRRAAATRGRPRVGPHPTLI